MDELTRVIKFRMADPVRYRILVQGALDQQWSNRLGGLTITVSAQDDGVMVTQLSGELMDQAALFGVLNTLYELHFPLIEITPLATATDKVGCG